MKYMKEVPTEDNPFKKLKVITGKNIEQQYKEFIKTVDLLERKQPTESMILVFYMERVK